MKANWKRTLLSLVLCAGFVWPAGAVSNTQPAASQTETSTAQSKPAAYTVKKMGLLGVKRTVESDNNTVKMLNKTAASLDSSSYMHRVPRPLRPVRAKVRFTPILSPAWKKP